MKPARSFASDNNAGIHPEILKAIAQANVGHVVGYGADPYTEATVTSHFFKADGTRTDEPPFHRTTRYP